MDYKIIVSPKAQIEILNAINYYSKYSINAPKNFISQIEKSYKALSTNPYYTIQYRNIRSLKLSKYPYSLYFSVNENDFVVEILSCFHNKLNPKKRPNIK
jgi:hypothetical protein